MYLINLCVLICVSIFVEHGQPLATGFVKICSHDGSNVTTTTYADFIKNYNQTFSICMYDELSSKLKLFLKPQGLKFFVTNYYDGNVRNGERLLAKIEQETDLEQIILLYKFLFEEMQFFDDLYSFAGMILGYRVISLMRSIQADINLLYIIENLPDSIKKFPFNETIVFEISHGVTVSTKHLAPAMTKFDYNRNKMELLGPADRTECPGCYWNMEPFDNGQAFRLFNTFNQEYFYADTNKYLSTEERRWTFTTANRSIIPGDSDTWQFEPIKGEDYRYRIRNSYYKELLFTPNSTVVVTTRRYGCFANTYRWLIHK